MPATNATELPTPSLEAPREWMQSAALEPAASWHPMRRVLFRFTLIYYALYFLPFPIDVLSSLRMFPRPFSWLGQLFATFTTTWEMGKPKYGLWDQATQTMCLWVGEHILNLPASGPGSIIIQPTGSGDTMLKVVESVCYLGIAAIATLAWSIVDRKRPHYPRLYAMFHVYVRFALAAILLGYGFAKFPPSQFQYPTPEKLMQPYGKSSMMGLLWTFMGASPAYTMFAGLSEIAAGALLLFRRTALLGALLGAGVMFNIVMLNFCYDVPVKFYSSHLFIACVVLALPHLSRLIDVAVLNRPTRPMVMWRPYGKRWQNWSLVALKTAAIAMILGLGCYQCFFAWRRYLNPQPLAAMNGLYKVESITVNGKPGPELDDSKRWRYFSFTKWGGALITNYADEPSYLGCKQDPEGHTLTLGVQGREFPLACTEEDGVLKLSGPFVRGDVEVVMRKVTDDAFPLKSRGFNWIQEMPVNW